MGKPRVITEVEMAHLPSELHRLVAHHLIAIGEWSLVRDKGTQGQREGVP
jgi:hypothetical protein